MSEKKVSERKVSERKVSERKAFASKAREKHALLIGCGELGLRAARKLLARGYRVTGARRSVDSLPDEIDTLQIDVTDAGTLSEISHQTWNVVIITLTARGEAAYRSVYLQGVKNILQALATGQQKPLILFASSTSVYAQNDGAIVDEQSETSPTGYSGQTMLQAEALIEASGFPAVSLRFSGIYSANRGGHLRAVLASGSICPEKPVRFSNRIHAEDCARVFMHLIERYERGELLLPVYLASDNSALPLREVMCWLAEREGLDVSSLQQDYMPNRGGNRRCSSQALLASGFSFKYPDFQSGYRAF